MTLHPVERAALLQVAYEVRESLDADGHCIRSALDQHQSFDESGGPASILLRSMVKAAVLKEVSRSGDLFSDTSSGAVDLVSYHGDTSRRFRLKAATVNAHGAFEFVVGDGSSLLQAEEDALWREERWVLGYTTTQDFQLRDIFVAEIIGISDTKVKKLILGDLISLTHHLGPVGPAFVSDEEDSLPGFDDETAVDEGDLDDGSSAG